MDTNQNYAPSGFFNVLMVDAESYLFSCFRELFTGMSNYPAYALYKGVVEKRTWNLHRDLGMIICGVIEDAGLEDWADCVCNQVLAVIESGEEDMEDFDVMVEDELGLNDAFSKAVLGAFFVMLDI